MCYVDVRDTFIKCVCVYTHSVRLVLIYVDSVVLHAYVIFFFFKQKTAYELRISDWSSDVCSSDLDTQNTRPIVRVNQGTELAITVAKDFDFSQVYGLGLK